MFKMNGGYAMINLNSANIYVEAINALNSGKPVLVGDDPQIYYADTIALSGDDVVITKGGKTITITDANSVSSSGYIQLHLYRYGISFSETGVNSGDTITVYVQTNTPITTDITLSDVVKTGDVITLGDLGDGEPIAIVSDVIPSNKLIQITLNDGTDLEYDEDVAIDSVTLIQQLF